MTGLNSEVTCYDKLRVTKRSFHDLCTLLREKCGFRDSVYINVEENVAMFLHVVGRGINMRMLRGIFKRLLETISRQSKKVLGTIISLSEEFIKLPNPSSELLKITDGSGLNMPLENLMRLMFQYMFQ